MRTLVSLIRDITERRRAEEALRQSEQRLRGMFENAPLGVVEVDADDRFVAANGGVCAILGRSRDELLGMTIRELTAPEDRGRSDEVNARLRSGPQDVIEYEKRYLRKDGTPVWVHVTISAVRDSSGRYAGGIGVVEEIGARKAAEADRERLVEALRDADRKKDEFLGILSHELRNPLAPIRNSVYILKHAEPGTPQALRAREVIDRQTNHMTRLVDDLLDVTRIARGKIELRRGEVNLADVVRRTGEDHRSLMTDREIELTVEVPEDPIWVRGDPTRLEQVVGNLLQNAAKFSQCRGRVALVLRADPGQAWISVRDTGVGIDRALLDKVFDPFVQAERTLARSSGGLGLGLALVKGLTELHGGAVSVRSDGPGRGSEFRIVLPLLTPAESLGEPPGPARRDGRVRQRRRRVLVVDDNVDAAESLAELVEVFGHDAVVAHDGPTAVATARVTHPDVILCDIGLPGMDGYEVARTLRADAALSGTHLVAVTGYAHPDDLERASRAGFDCHVAKPPSPEEIDRLLQ
jgi:PAS domain S-box-containing protein